MAVECHVVEFVGAEQVDAVGLGEQPAPDLTGAKAATADVEQALLTGLAAGAADGQVLRAERYSTRPAPPAVQYGLTVDTADRWRLFVACVGTAGAGRQLRADCYFSPAARI